MRTICPHPSYEFMKKSFFNVRVRSGYNFMCIVIVTELIFVLFLAIPGKVKVSKSESNL